MSQKDEICPSCKKPWTAQYHTFLCFRPDGCPQIECHRDPRLTPCPHFNGANVLWDRAEAAESGAALAKKTAELSAALTANARLELSDTQQRTALAKAAETTAKAVADAVKAAKDAMQADLDKARNELSLSDGFTKVLESKVAELNGKIEEISAGLAIETARADEAEARAAAAEARVVQQAKAITALVEKDAVIEIVSVEAEPGTDPKDVVDLDKRKTPSAPRPVPPPPPAPQPVAAAPAAAVQPATPATPETVPAPADAAQSVLLCMCSCDKPAAKVAKDKWAYKAGGFFPEIAACKKVANHADEIYALLEEQRDQLVNPPDDSTEIPSMFEDITPTANN